ncbi:6707_t:CDS:2 [Entrophospora sp. SA101]|nr:6707_t:CDS:2 [Entrophospora sp. SA101]
MGLNSQYEQQETYLRQKNEKLKLSSNKFLSLGNNLPFRLMIAFPLLIVSIMTGINLVLFWSIGYWLSRVATNFLTSGNYSASVQRINNFLQLPEKNDNLEKLKLTNEIKSISFKTVNFKYKSSQNWVLQNYNETFEAKKINRLSGENGRGKSTILYLILGLIEPDSGQIIITDLQGQNYNLHQDINLQHWRENNVAYCSHDNLIEGASTGQKQLANINKVLKAKKSATIFLFDEADNALDQAKQTQFYQKQTILITLRSFIDLEGYLNLSNFANLKILNCSKNKICSLSVDSNALVYLDCSFNCLLDARFIIESIKCPENLIYLDFRNNKFFPVTLEIFSNFSNLEEIYLGTTCPSRISSNVYNRFYGSLQPIEKLKKLRILCIRNTEINRGFRYLSNNLEKLFIKKDENLLEEKLKISKKLIDYLRNELENSESQKSNLEKELNNKKSILENLKNDLEEKKNNLEKSQKEFEKINSEVKNKLIISESKEKELTKKVEDLQAEKIIYKEANNAIREKYKSVMEENGQLRVQLELKSKKEEINENKIEVPIKEITRKI